MVQFHVLYIRKYSFFLCFKTYIMKYYFYYLYNNIKLLLILYTLIILILYLTYSIFDCNYIEFLQTIECLDESNNESSSDKVSYLNTPFTIKELTIEEIQQMYEVHPEYTLGSRYF